MRGSLSGSFLRTTGGTMTGQLTINSDVAPLIILNRPDGLSSQFIAARLAGADRWRMVTMSTEPGYRLTDGGGADRLSARLDNGLLGGSIIPLSMLRREELDGENAGAVTLVAAGVTTIVDVTAAANVVAGDHVVCYVDVTGTKGATAGMVTLELLDQGTANVQWAKDAILTRRHWDWPVSTVYGVALTAIARVVNGGVLTMRLQGQSLGSDLSIGAGGGELRLLILRDSA